MRLVYVYDLPVYRLTEEAYNEQREAWIADRVARIAGISDERATSFRATLFVDYGGAWRFNEIIGYLRLHVLGTQIRAEWWRVNATRIVRTRKKQFEERGWKLAAETEIDPPRDSPAILKAIREHLQDCREELKGRHIDVSTFEALAPLVDWAQLLALG